MIYHIHTVDMLEVAPLPKYIEDCNEEQLKDILVMLESFLPKHTNVIISTDEGVEKIIRGSAAPSRSAIVQRILNAMGIDPWATAIHACKGDYNPG